MGGTLYSFLFGRLILLGGWTKTKRDFIYEAISSGEFYNKGKFRYGIFNVRNIEIAGEEFAYGVLAKYKQNLEGEVVNEKKKEIQEEVLIKGVVGKSDFFLHYESEIIAFREIKNRISQEQFRDIFARLIEAGQHNFFVSAKISIIEEECKIIDALKQFESVNCITISVHPTNPNNRPIYDKLDERLKKLQAENLKQTIESKDGSLNKNELMNDEIFGGIVMSSDGYGSSSISGKMDGRSVTISTGESPIKKKIEGKASPEEKIEGLLQIFKKINNGKDE